MIASGHRCIADLVLVTRGLDNDLWRGQIGRPPHCCVALLLAREVHAHLWTHLVEGR